MSLDKYYSQELMDQLKLATALSRHEVQMNYLRMQNLQLHAEMRVMYQRAGTDIRPLFCMPDGSWPIISGQDLGRLLELAYLGDGGAILACSYYAGKGWIIPRGSSWTGSTAVTHLAISPEVPGKVPQTVATSVIPEGVTILPQRIGDEEREKVLERLRDMHARGYLDPAETDARQDAAIAAKTEADLSVLVQDLPSPVKPAPAGTLRPVRHIPYTVVMCGMLALLLMIGIGFFAGFPYLIPLYGAMACISYRKWKTKGKEMT